MHDTPPADGRQQTTCPPRAGVSGGSGVAWSRGLLRAWTAGTVASALSAAVLMASTRRRHGDAAMGLNAPSHWVFGNAALHARGWSRRYTLSGAVIHHLSALLWAGALQVWLQRAARHATAAPSPAANLGAAAAVTGIAALTDLKLVPHRLTPGFQHHVSLLELAAVYVAFGAGLAWTALAARRRGE